MRFTVDRIDHIVLNVTDVEITAAWYQRVLGMEREDFGPDNRTALKFGGQKINLRPADADPGSWLTGVERCGPAPAISASSPRCRRTRWSAICTIAACRSWRAGRADRRARADPLGVLPRSGRQPGRDRLLSSALMDSVLRDRVGLAAFACFLASIPLANWMIGHVGTVCVPQGPCLVPVAPGLMAPSGVLTVGAALVLRDVVQRCLGLTWGLAAIVVGTVLSVLVAPASLVLASGAAFALSELADFAVYTPLQRRRLVLAVVLRRWSGWWWIRWCS